ncbi:hypothetical protein ACUN0C_11200 [Faunimonas sp. B44]|uniref:hypothetical protein n=1 Tax=Faunimonas sp. B44 TaxID=3461493 RepID=UPI004043D1AA
MKKWLITIGLFLLFAWSISGSDENRKATPRSAATACDGGQTIGDVVAVSGDYDVRSSPSENAGRIKNVKASEALRSTVYHRIDNSTTVRRLCVDRDWTLVQIVSPEWLTHVRGWVPDTTLREIERTASGERVYKEEDFIWDEDTSAFKPQILQIVNRIVNERPGCTTIDTASVAKSPSRSAPGDPVFFVTCGNVGTQMFNVWFRPGEADAVGGNGGQQIQSREHGELQARIRVTVVGGNRPTIRGDTNLPDGTELLIMVSREDIEYRAEEKVNVAGGHFEAGPFLWTGDDLPGGNYSVEVLMPAPAVQSDSVRKVTGEQGERLTGPLIQNTEAGAVVRGAMTVSINGPPPRQPRRKDHTVNASDKDVYNAFALCRAFDAIGLLSKPCDVSVWGSTVDLSIDMSTVEALRFCSKIPTMTRKVGVNFSSEWSLRIYSPYSNGNTIAICRL